MADRRSSSSSDDPTKGKGKSLKGGDGSAREAHHPWLWGFFQREQPNSRASQTKRSGEFVFPKADVPGRKAPTDEVPASSNDPRPRSEAASGTDHKQISSENASQHLPDTKPHQGEDQGSPALDLLRSLNSRQPAKPITDSTETRKQKPPSNSSNSSSFVFPTMEVPGSKRDNEAT